MKFLQQNISLLKKKQKKNTHQFAEVQAVNDPRLGLLILGVQAHDVQRVHGVHNGRAHVLLAEDARRVPLLADGSQLVLRPRVRLVAVPGVQHHLTKQTHSLGILFNVTSVPLFTQNICPGKTNIFEG